jgi:hypothetical protein
MLSNYELVRGVIRIASAISSTFTKSSLANEAFPARSRRLSAQVLFENHPSLFKYIYVPSFVSVFFWISQGSIPKISQLSVKFLRRLWNVQWCRRNHIYAVEEGNNMRPGPVTIAKKRVRRVSPLLTKSCAVESRFVWGHSEIEG